MDNPSKCPFTDNDSLAVDPSTLLWMYNEREASFRYPAIWFSLVVFFIGLPGNALVVYAYGLRFKRTTANIYILWLGIFDLICCFVSIPFETFTLRFPMMYGMNIPCKVFRTISVLAYASQALMLVCIALDRYYKVCVPLRRFHRTKPYNNLLVVLLLSVFLSWPSGFVYGVKTIQTCYTSVVGTRCAVPNVMENSVFPMLYYGFHVIVFIGAMVLVSFIYIRIVTRVLQWKKKSKEVQGVYDRRQTEHRQENKLKKTSVLRRAVYIVGGNVDLGSSNVSCTDYRQSSDSVINHAHFRDNESQNVTVRHISGLHDRAHVYKTTVIFLVVTLTFLLSYLPYLAGEFLLKSNVVDIYDLNQDMKAFMEIVAKSYCINNATNAIIYSIFNKNFRQEIFNLFKSAKT